MAAGASVKDLAKAVGAYLSSPTLPLPQELTLVIDAYLEKHPRQDDPAQDRLHEELLQIHQKLVQGHPELLAAFLAILRTLRPSLSSGAKSLQWFDVLNEDVLDFVWQEKDLAGETVAVIEETVASKADDLEALGFMISRSLERWVGFAEAAAQTNDPSIAFKEKMIRKTMLTWGKKQPKVLFVTLNEHLMKKESRARSISLLCEFIRTQPPHLHMVAQTPVFDNIITCLQRDTSTTVVSLALTALTMLLPHLPSSLVPYLPTLFNIYARLLFWDREQSPEASASAGTQPEAGDQWELVRFSPESEGTEIPQLLDYFTLLYGLFPINLMDYIRKPQRYLRHANAPNPDDIEVQPSEIRYRSERFRQMHLLHPNFYSLTIDSEKTDFGRWIKSEPAVVVAECMALCVANGPGPDNAASAMPLGGETSPFGGDEADRSSSGGALLSNSAVLSPPQGPLNSSWRHAQSTAVESSAGSRAHSTVMRQNSQSSHLSRRDSLETRGREASVDSPTLPPLMVPSPSQTQLQDMIHSNKLMKSNLGQSLASDSVPSLALSHQESIPERPPAASGASHSQSAIRFPLAVTESGGEVARLRRQIMVLNNDLNFERYMKQQHMAHIGELRRRHMKEAATEAETQSLIINNRNLRSQVENAKRAELQVRKDSERSRMLAKKWETDLSAKLKTLREEQKKRNAEMESLRRELDLAKDECEKLRALVCDAEVKEINSKQTMQSIDADIAELGRLRGEVERLTASERDYQARQLETETKLAAAAAAEQRSEVLAMQLQSLQGEKEATQDYYESQIVVLNTKLAEALKNSRGRGDGELTAMFESALAASRAKQSELQKQYSQLMRKHTVLQGALLEKAQSGRSRNDAASSAEADAEVSAIVEHSYGPRAARTQHGGSDPDGNDWSRQDSLGSANSSAGTAIHQPQSPPHGGVGSPGSSGSPQVERYYGRGGVQNILRKDKKEKKREDGEKKEKKSSGIRAIRGFV